MCVCSVDDALSAIGIMLPDPYCYIILPVVYLDYSSSLRTFGMPIISINAAWLPMHPSIYQVSSHGADVSSCVVMYSMEGRNKRISSVFLRMTSDMDYLMNVTKSFHDE